MPTIMWVWFKTPLYFFFLGTTLGVPAILFLHTGGRLTFSNRHGGRLVLTSPAMAHSSNTFVLDLVKHTH